MSQSGILDLFAQGNLSSPCQSSSFNIYRLCTCSTATLDLSYQSHFITILQALTVGQKELRTQLSLVPSKLRRAIDNLQLALAQQAQTVGSVPAGMQPYDKSYQNYAKRLTDQSRST